MTQIGAATPKTSVKLPNWAIAILLVATALVVIGTGVGWWMTWPARSARDFLDLLAAEKYDQAQARFHWKPAWQNQTFALFSREHRVVAANLNSEPRTVLDVALARQRFRYGQSRVYQFTVERGKVVESGYRP